MKKAAFIDVDGTLTKDISSWEKAHNYFGKQDEAILRGMEKNTARYYAGEITYNEWAILDVELWKGRPFSELQKALLPPKMIKNAKKGVMQLKKEEYDIVLVSGGIDILVNDVADRVIADAAYSNTIHHSNGIIDGNVTIGVGEKAPVVQEVANKFGYDLSQSLAIGDNVNDIDMFQTVGFSVAFNADKDQVKQSASYVSVNDNFLDFINEVLDVYPHNGRLS
jgi:phosphoserine phosphatase